MKFQKGDVVKIYNHDGLGSEVFEGVATVVSQTVFHKNFYVVRFGNGDVVSRFVDASRQGE